MTSELSESPNKYESSSRQYVDIIVILCLAVLPSMYRSFMIVGNGSRWAESTFTQLMLALIVSSIQIAAPILLIMRLRKVVWSDHGFVSCRPIRDVLVGVGLMVASYLAYYLCGYGLLFAGQNFTADTNGLSKMTIEASLTHSSLVLILIASAANSFTEELAMRSYLIPDLRT